MRTCPLGPDGPVSTNLAYGCMRVVHTWDPTEVDATRRAEAVRIIQAAYEIGYRHFDNADIYCHGVCEQVLGEALRSTAGMREASLIVTKCGIRFEDKPPGSPKQFDQTADYILRSCEGSLQRLGIETIDVYLLHRIDFLLPAEEVAAAFEKLIAAGKVKYLGVSNCSIAQLDLLRKVCPMPIVCNQIHLHPARLEPWESGELHELQVRDVTPTAWSPVNRGIFAAGGQVPEGDANAERLRAIVAALDAAAESMGVSRTVATLAWLMRHPSGIVPIVGSTKPEHLRDAAKASEVTMHRDDWYRIFTAARGRQLP